MSERAKRQPIPVELRKQVKHEQNCKCFICHQQFPEQDLYIHHIIPVAHHKRGQGEYANRRENLCALCGKEGNDCHEWADKMAFEERIYLTDLIEMEEGREYLVSRAN